MQLATLSDWLEYLEQQHLQLTGKSIDLGLERIRSVAEKLGLLSLKNKPSAKVITVAGTNGKGSFVTALSALLSAQGYRVGCYTSPHIHKFNERIAIDQQCVDDERLLAAFNAIREAQDSLALSLSYFEFTTLAGLYCFKQEALDYILLEVGLGGRLDAVNIIEPDWAVVTSIALDHQDFLGDDLESIAAEKCGILREQTPLLLLDEQPLAILAQAVQGRFSLRAGRDFNIAITPLASEPDRQGDRQSNSASGLTWRLDFPATLSEPLGSTNQTAALLSFKQLKTLLQAMPCQLDSGLAMTSVAGALLLFNQLMYERIEASEFAQGASLLPLPEQLACLAQLSFAGRFQQFSVDGVQIIFDVAHNEAALAQLQKRISAKPLVKVGPDEPKRVALFAMFDDKPLDRCIEIFKDEFFAWFLAEDKHPRAIAPSDIAARLHQHGINMISVSKNFTQAFARLRQICQPGDQIIVFGSFLPVGALLNKVESLADKTQDEQG